MCRQTAVWKRKAKQHAAIAGAQELLNSLRCQIHRLHQDILAVICRHSTPSTCSTLLHKMLLQICLEDQAAVSLPFAAFAKQGNDSL